MHHSNQNSDTIISKVEALRKYNGFQSFLPFSTMAQQCHLTIKLASRRKGATTMEETKIIYHIDDEETPYLVKLTISPERVTLADFKNVLNRPNYKYFFKSMDDDFGLCYQTLYNHITSEPMDSNT
ncbi:hypothetical protein E2986_13257 [Frieseomelitta varia]|uniref:DIX domain-containing protein n=1 Tax=Frieseomelitta varia TaxID=561572 RepID=A0A833S0G5_9HYME|nr:hypothetical protein E2986_13257 [Frieseomelitta varia]